MSMIFETHAHYNDEAFREDREEIFAQLEEKRIGRVVNIASDLESIDECLDLAENHPFMYCALGIHPSDSAPLTDALLAGIRDKLSNPRVVAVGEIGLDYYWDKTEREIQKKWFMAQLDLAKELELPVVIHSREAAQDTFDIIKKAGIPEGMLVMHCYSYSPEMAREYLKMGYYLGIGGVVTFKNAKKLKETVAMAPLAQLLTETDCPYLTPVPFRGKRNDSGKIPLVLDEIARIKETDRDETEAVCYENALRFYRLQEHYGMSS